MDGAWPALQRHMEAELAMVEEHDHLSSQLRPCWIFVSNVIDAKNDGLSFAEPSVGAGKLGGQPDLPLGAAWPLTESGESMDFLAQIRLDDGLPLPHLPGAGLLLFFAGSDDEPSCVDHHVLYVPAGTDLARRRRPGDERFEYSHDYSPYPLAWVPSMAIPRRRSYFTGQDGSEVAEFAIQRALDGAALRLAGVNATRFAEQGGCLTRFGGWPLDHDDAPALSAYIDEAGFGSHEVYRHHWERNSAFRQLQRSRDELAASAAGVGTFAERIQTLLELADSGDGFAAWASDQLADHESELGRWKQLLSLDSHMEIGMCFWDAGRYEFVTHERDFNTSEFNGRMDLCEFG